MIVYLAGPIDMVSGDISRAWREEVTQLLAKRGMGVYNPVTAFGGVVESGDAIKSVFDINMAALRSCQFAIFLMGPEYPSIGTPIELYECYVNSIPFSVVWSAQSKGALPIYLLHLASGKIHGSFAGAVGAASLHQSGVE